MHPVSITQAILLGIMATAPFVFGAPVESQGLARREISVRVPPPDEFGSWEDKRDVPPPDEFGSWEKRSAELEVRHHTEAQIAAKEAAAAAAAGVKTCQRKRSPHHTEAQIAAKKAAEAAAGRTATTTAPAAAATPPMIVSSFAMVANWQVASWEDQSHDSVALAAALTV